MTALKYGWSGRTSENGLSWPMNRVASPDSFVARTITSSSIMAASALERGFCGS